MDAAYLSKVAGGAFDPNPRAGVETNMMDGSGGEGPFGKVGGDMGMPGQSEGLSVGGASFDQAGILASMKQNNALGKGPVEVAAGIAEHQAGGEMKLSDAGLHNTGQGLAASAPVTPQVLKAASAITQQQGG